MTTEKRQVIETLAFCIWEKNGKPDGHALDHWLEAEYLILTNTFVEDESLIVGVGRDSAPVSTQ